MTFFCPADIMGEITEYCFIFPVFGENSSFEWLIFMTLEVLISCMHQPDGTIADRSGISCNALIVNQCDREDDQEFDAGRVRMLSTKERGLTRSRNMALDHARGDICLLCDDDEVFVPDFDKKMLDSWQSLPQADVVIFKMVNRPPSFPDRVMELRFPKTLKVSSWQISFRREALLKSGVRFDELLGAGSGNGAEEELKFLTDCRRAGLKIWYVPVEIASVSQEASTWFGGFTEKFFEDRGATTRYILGVPMALLYGVYYVLKKRPKYRDGLTVRQAWKALLRGIRENRIGKLKEKRRNTGASVG